MAFLAAPQPFSLELTTARFRAFGLDRATVWEDGALYRAVGRREVRIGPADGGVEVEPLDAQTEAIVRKAHCPVLVHKQPVHKLAGAGA